MKWVFVVRFKEPGNGSKPTCIKSYKTTASCPKDAAKKMRRKGRILSVKKKKRLY